MIAFKRQVKYLDSLLSKKVREAGRESDIPCYFAGRDSVRCNGALQCNHIIGRRHFRLRWDYMNVVPGCGGHNFYYKWNEPDLHNLIKEIDPIRWEYLEKTKKLTSKYSVSDLKLIELFIIQNDYNYLRVLPNTNERLVI